MYTLIAFKPEHSVYCGGGYYITLSAICIREDHTTREEIIARIIELKTIQQIQEHRYGKDLDCVFEDFWIFSGEPDTDILFDALYSVKEWRRINKPEEWAREEQLNKEMAINNAKVFAKLQEIGLIPKKE